MENKVLSGYSEVDLTMILKVLDFTDQDENVIQNNSASQMSTRPLLAIVMSTVEGGKYKGGCLKVLFYLF